MSSIGEFIDNVVSNWKNNFGENWAGLNPVAIGIKVGTGMLFAQKVWQEAGGKSLGVGGSAVFVGAFLMSVEFAYINAPVTSFFTEIGKEAFRLFYQLTEPGSPTDPGTPTEPASPTGDWGLNPFRPPGGGYGGGPSGGGSDSGWTWSPFGGAEQAKWDPIILDLDGDGIELTTIDNGTYFDLDTSGFAERTGWVKADDGLLVQDRNGDGIINDGQELFGNQTLLKDGSKADSGFQALAELDSNFDGKIDANDGDYAKLRVWRDLNGDGYSSTNELFTLNELNIQSVSLATTVSNINNNGSTQVKTGSYQKQDGTSWSLGEFLLDSDPIHSVDTQYVDVLEEIAGLPYLQGYGNVHDLWQAVALDTSGSLKALVQSFGYEKDSSKREQLLDQILYKWTNSDTVSSNSRGSNIDARQLTVLEKMFGQQFTGYVTTSGSTANPNPEAAKILNNIYAQVKEYFYDRLVMQTHLVDVFNVIQFSWDEANSCMTGTLSGVRKLLDDGLKADVTTGMSALSEFVRVISNMGFASASADYSGFRSYFITNYGADAALIFEAGGRNILYGSDTSETLQSSTLGSLVKSGGGNDVVQGSASSDVIYGDSGNDNLYGQAGNDVLNGGAGNDYLNGGAGNDTYIWGQGAGNDTIRNDSASGDNDVVQLTGTLTADALDVYRVGLTDLQLKIKQTGELLTISNWFVGSSYQPQVKLADGMALAVADMIGKGEVSTPTENTDYLYGGINNDIIDGLGGNDVIYGSQSTDTDAAGTGNDMLTGGGGNDYVYGQDGDDTLAGGSGNDNLYGSVGNDVLDGGAGNDYLNGGAGNDSYVWGLGVGNDTIYNDGASGDVDVVQVTGELTADSVDVLRIGGSGLQLKIKATGETLTFSNWYAGANYQVTAVNFADGTVLTAADMVARAISVPTEGDDYLYGGAGSDTISGLDGDDYLFGSQSTSITATGTGNDVLNGGEGSDGLYGQDGDDTLLGGMGNDYLYGGAGNDIEDGGGDNDYLYGHDGDDILTGGSGNDELYGSVGNDVLDGGAGNDYLNGGAGNDSYVWGTGVGNDTIYNDGASGDVDIVQLTGDLTADSFEIYLIGYRDLQLKNKQTGETLTFTGWYSGTNSQPQVKFADGSSFTALDMMARAVSVATENSDYLYGETGNDIINGLGGDDYIFGSQSNDETAIGTGNDILDGGDGDDYVYGQDGDDTLLGGNGNDYMRGGDGDDTLLGGSGRDQLYGGAGNDSLNGGDGNDYMIGGAGNDSYTWGSGVGNDEIYNDGASGDVDIVQLTGDLTADSFEIYRIGSRDLVLKNKQTAETLTFAGWYVDTRNQVTAVNFADSTVLTGADMMARAVSVATENSEYLYGGIGDDAINGLGGDDYIYGSQSANKTATGTGNDILDGGNGNDYVYGQDGDDILLGGSGRDQLYGGMGNDSLDGGAGNDYMSGGAGNDCYIWGTGMGNDTIYNDGASSDVDIVRLTGDLTADSFEIYRTGSGDLQLKNKQTGETLTFACWYVSSNFQVKAVSFADGTVLPAADMMARAVSVATENSEYLYGGIGDDTINGMGGEDFIYGSQSNDEMATGTGNDILDGGDGNDYVYGQDGDDTLLGGNGNDDMSGGAGDDTLAGGSGDDYLYGGVGNDSLDGGAGNDYMSGGAGNDSYTWGSGVGNDTIYNGGASGDVDIVQLTGDLTAGSFEIYRIGYADLQLKNKQTGETLTFARWYDGTHNQVTAVNFADGMVLSADDMMARAVSVATENSEYLYGGTGNDTINGLGGDDQIFGSQSTDEMATGTGNDVLDGGNGRDDLYGQDGDDTLLGGSGNDCLYGGAGDDCLDGGSDNDYMIGEDGDDMLVGGSGDDGLYGEAGNDVLDGGAGNDYMSGGAGNDSYTWGSGVGNDTIDNDGASGDVDIVQLTGDLTADSFEFYPIASGALQLRNKQTGETLTFVDWYDDTHNQVTAVKFADGTVLTAADMMAKTVSVATENSDYLYGGTGNDTINGLGGDDQIYGSQSTSGTATGTGNDILDGGDGDDYISGGDGDDTLLGGSGNDCLVEGAGNDSLDGGDGDDYLYGGAGNDVLEGGAGNDILQGGLNDDIYLFGIGSGNDTIDSYEGTTDNGLDTLQFQNLVLASIEFAKDNDDLVCTITQTGETIRLSNWTWGTDYQVDQFQFSDKVLTADQVNQKIA